METIRDLNNIEFIAVLVFFAFIAWLMYKD